MKIDNNSEKTYDTGTKPESWNRQYARIKETIDKLAFKIYKNKKSQEITVEFKMKSILANSDAHYNTFLTQSGYEKLCQYNSVEKVGQTGKIRLNPYEWLRHRNLGESNEYYIKEVYEGLDRDIGDE